MFSSQRAARNKIRHAYIIRVNDQAIYTKDDAISALRRARDRMKQDSNAVVDIEFAIDRAPVGKAKRRAQEDYNL